MFRPPAIFRKRNDLFIYDRSLVNKSRMAKDEAPKTGVFGMLSEFCETRSIHGLAYLGDRKRRLIERVCWAIAIASSLSLCGFGTLKLWQSHGTDRIVLRSSKIPVSIDTIPFPAVTICPVSKAAAKKFNYTDVYRSLMKLDGENSRNVTPTEFETMKVMNHLCEFTKTKKVLELFSDSYATKSVYETMIKIEPDINETFTSCKLFDEWIDCEKIFFPTLTDAGYCYTFNTLRLPETLTDEVFFNVSHVPTQKRISTWNIDYGYYKSMDGINQEPYPFRVIDAGLQYSLTVILKINNNDIDYLCGGSIQGFKIGFHSPCEIPRGRKHFFNLSPNRAAFYLIDPKYTKTEAKMRKFDPQKRQCYFNTERKLRFYHQYTRVHCMTECLSNHTLTQCGCVHFQMMHSKDTKICGTLKIKCYRQAARNFYNSEDVIKCNCLPSCSELTYDAYPSTTDFDFVRTLSHSVKDEDIELENVSFSRLIVSFKDEVFIPVYRIENYSWADILSYIGGFCGLFMGASLLSIIELIYYFTLRAYFKYRSNREANHRHVAPVFPYLP